MNKATALRKLFAEKPLTIIVGAHNGLSAKLVENAGFDGIWASSLEISASYGVPDASLISMSQFVEAARSMNEVIDIPVVVDGDTGYGNAINVMYAVKKYEEAGIAALIMEEKKFPKDNSLLQGGRQELLPIEEFAGKIEAAKAAQKNPDFMVMARIEALIAGHGQDEAQMRARRYAEAGADAIFIHSKSSSPEEVITFDKNWDLDVPLILTPTNYFTLRETDIKQMKNVKMVIYANHCLRASIKAMENILAKIKNDGGIYDINDSIATVPHIFELQGVPQMKEKEKKYLR